MTQIVWDEVGERRFETGVDHGVLYPPNSPGVPWNGLTAVNENRGGEVKTYYQDGIPYLVHQTPGAYSAKLNAFTYPDELDALVGNTQSLAVGMYLHNQRGAVPFNLAYRTRIGDDVSGIEAGYKIHLLYNVIAIPSDFSYGTIDASSDATPMEWELRGIPPTDLASVRPTAHISLDSSEIDPALLTELEAMLYGTDESVPTFPTQLLLKSMTEVGELGAGTGGEEEE